MRKRFYVWLWGKANHVSVWALRRADKLGYLEDRNAYFERLRNERGRTPVA